MSKLCDHCNAHRVRYRKDYPSSDKRAYRIHHARGCPNFGKIPPSVIPPTCMVCGERHLPGECKGVARMAL